MNEEILDHPAPPDNATISDLVADLVRGQAVLVNRARARLIKLEQAQLAELMPHLFAAMHVNPTDDVVQYNLAAVIGAYDGVVEEHFESALRVLIDERVAIMAIATALTAMHGPRAPRALPGLFRAWRHHDGKSSVTNEVRKAVIRQAGIEGYTVLLQLVDHLPGEPTADELAALADRFGIDVDELPTKAMVIRTTSSEKVA